MIQLSTEYIEESIRVDLLPHQQYYVDQGDFVPVWEVYDLGYPMFDDPPREYTVRYDDLSPTAMPLGEQYASDALQAAVPHSIPDTGHENAIFIARGARDFVPTLEMEIELAIITRWGNLGQASIEGTEGTPLIATGDVVSQYAAGVPGDLTDAMRRLGHAAETGDEPASQYYLDVLGQLPARGPAWIIGGAPGTRVGDPDILSGDAYPDVEYLAATITHVLRLDHEDPIDALVVDDLESRFRFIADQWRDETGMLSIDEEFTAGNDAAGSDDVEVIIESLREHGLQDFAVQLEHKKRVIEDDPDELPISPESVRSFVGFVTAQPLPGSPRVTVDPYGYVGLEWVIPNPYTLGPSRTEASSGRDDDHVWGKGDGVLGVWFLPSGMVRVYGTSGPVGQGLERMRVNSTVTPSYVINVVEPFLSRLEAR